MTQEPVEYTAPAPFPEAGHVMFGIPGVLYSQVRIPLVYDINEMNVLVASAMETAKLLREAYQETFADEFVTREAPQAQPVPRLAQQPQRAAQGARRATDLDPNLVVTGNCPEHGIVARPSKLEYQEIEIDAESGVERYAKYYCVPNGAPRHSLYARQLV